MTTTKDDDVVRHIRGSSSLLVGRLLAMVIALGTQFVIVNVIDKAEFGVFAFGLTLVSTFRVLVSFGDSQSVGRFLTLDAENHDRAGFRATLIVVLGRIVLVSLLVIGAVAVGVRQLTNTFLSAESDSSVVLILVLLAPLEAVGAALGAVFAVFGQVRMVLLRKYLYAPLVRLAAVLLLAFGGFGVKALAIAYVSGEVLGLLLYATLARRSISMLGTRPEPGEVRSGIKPRVKPYLQFSLPAGTVEMVSIVMTTVTVMFLGWWHGPEAVADFRSVFPLGRLNQMVLLTFSVLFAPLATRFFARSDRAGMEHAYWQTSAYLMVLSFPIFAVSVPLAWALVPWLFGEQYAVAAPVLAVLGSAYFLHSAFGYNALVLQIHGRVRWVLTTNVAAMATSVIVGLLVIPPLGAVGVSWSVLAALTVQNVANQVGLHRHLDFAWIDPVIIRISTVSVALAGVLGCLAWLGTPLFALLPSAAIASLVLLVAAQRSLDLAEAFPALARLPILGRLVS